MKAVYQRYLSWYDAHPANLHNLPPVPAAKKYVDYMGGMDALMQRAQADFDQGEYRWVAEVMKHAVYAQPDHAAARELAASALEQMGFQAESSTWRNAYLLGAFEYRNGPPKRAGVLGNSLINALSNALLFDALAVRLNAPKAGDQKFAIAWHFTDSAEHWLMELSNGALSCLQTDTQPAADVSLAMARRTLEGIIQQQLLPLQAVTEGKLKVEGNPALLATFFGLLDRFPGNFPVVDAAAWPA